ncbi:MAG: chloride channel protein [Polyangiaceae bacterium]
MARATRSPTESARAVAALVVVALGAALFAVAFRTLLARVFSLAGAHNVVSLFERLPWWARLLLPAAGALLAGLTGRLSPKSQGVGDVMEAVALGRTQLSLRTTLPKSLGSWLAQVGGGSVGREGPLILFGASLASEVARYSGLSEPRARALMAAGTAAGFAAAYNTPFAAILFVLEIVTGVAAFEAVVGTVFATAIATAATRALVGGGPIYGQRGFVLASSLELVAHTGLGVLAALAVFAFTTGLALGERVFARLGQPWRAACGGLVVGAVATLLPSITGNGYEPLNQLLDGEVALAGVLVLILAKPFATVASVSSGSPGGVFTPTLLLGAAMGTVLHAVLARLLPGVALGGAGAYALVGMAAATAATTHAPVMAAVLVFELSQDYAVVLPLLLATATATVISRRLGRDSMYAAELRRRGVVWELTLEGRRVEKDGQSARSE